MAEPEWDVSLDPPVAVPGQPLTATVRYTPARDHEARGVSALLRCTERYRYSRTESRLGADGKPTAQRVTRTDTQELHRAEVPLAGPGRFTRGQPAAWEVALEVPGLGPASFEAEVLRCDWTLELKADVPMGLDARIELPIHVAQPMALLRAGVVAAGQYALFEEAPANVDHFPAQIRLEPVPINLAAPFAGAFTVETPEPIEVQEVRLELRVRAAVTVSGGHDEEITVARGTLAGAGPHAFGGAFGTHRFTADASGCWLPTVDLPHGEGRGVFHVILARAWAPDIHYVRDVALATTDRL
jgi:hypothetical protein